MNKRDGPKWKFIAGRLCLDFVNSVAGRLQERVKPSYAFTIREDRLENYEDLVRWGKEAGVVKEGDFRHLAAFASQEAKEASMVYGRGKALRESLYRTFKNIIEGWEVGEADTRILNDECTIAREHQRLVYTKDRFVWDFEPAENALDCVLWRIALSGAELLSSSELLSRVRECPGPDCGWLFLDTSKNGSRQWCDMKDCGNLAKVRRFRERHR